MKTKKYCLILAVFAGVLFLPAFGQIEPPLPEYEPLLIGQANPALAEIDKLYVRVRHGFEPNSHGLVIEELEKLVADRLKEAGITIAETDIDKAGPDAAKMLKVLKRRIESTKGLKFFAPHIPELCIDIDTLDIEHLQQVVFHIQISLARLVHLEKEDLLTFKTDVWQSEPIMQAASAENTPEKIISIVLQQTDTFITAYLDANPKGVQPAVQSEVTERKYVASKNSKVFHKPDCVWVQRIAPKNLVYYKTRDEAVNDGKRPCKTCNP